MDQKRVLIVSLVLLVFTTASYAGRMTYKEILQKGVKPAIAPAFDFPLSKQHENGCFGFAVKNMADYKYQIKIDVADAEKKIGKPRESLWKSENIMDFLALYDLQLAWQYDALSFFELLTQGEPVLIQYRWWYNNHSTWVGHFVAVYSFDDKGVWVSESASNKHVHVPYSDLFDESGVYTLFAFASLKRTGE